jgi:hypothetical protein
MMIDRIIELWIASGAYYKPKNSNEAKRIWRVQYRQFRQQNPQAIWLMDAGAACSKSLTFTAISVSAYYIYLYNQVTVGLA